MKRYLSDVIYYAILLVCLCWLTTLGSWQVMQGDFLSEAYDSLGVHLLRGSAEVDASAIQFERYDNKGRVFMYFGPFPAVLRIIFNFIVPGHYGAWSRVSTVLAALISAIAFSRMVASALMLNQSVPSRAKSWLTVAAPFIFCLATPFAQLVSTTPLFNEAMAWGVCGTMCSIAAIVCMLATPDRQARCMVLFSIGFAISLLSRLTTALPTLLLMPLVFSQYAHIEYSARRARSTTLRRLAIPVGIVLAAFSFQLWYNYARFDSVFIFRDLSKYYFTKTHMGSDFSLSRLPDSFAHYFGVSSRHFVSRLPFTRMVTSVYQRPELYVQLWREQSISLALSAPWLLIPGSIGVFYAVVRPCKLLVRAALLATLVEAGLVMAYFFISQRYAAELVPFLALGVFVFLSQCRLSNQLLGGLFALSGVSILVTLSSTITFNMLFNPSTPLALHHRFGPLFFPQVELALRQSDANSISDLSPLPDSSGAIAPHINQDAFGKPLQLFGYVPVKGLGMRAGSRISYEVPANMTEFHAIALLSEHSAACNQITLAFEGHDEKGRLLFHQKISSNTREPVPFSAPLLGAHKLSISLHQDIRVPLCDSANLIAARFG
jgi:hypothetical protein